MRRSTTTTLSIMPDLALGQVLSILLLTRLTFILLLRCRMCRLMLRMLVSRLAVQRLLQMASVINCKLHPHRVLLVYFFS